MPNEQHQATWHLQDSGTAGQADVSQQRSGQAQLQLGCYGLLLIAGSCLCATSCWWFGEFHLLEFWCRVDGCHHLPASVMHNVRCQGPLWPPSRTLSTPKDCPKHTSVVLAFTGAAPRVNLERLSFSFGVTFGLQEQLNFRGAQMTPKVNVHPLALYFQSHSMPLNHTPPTATSEIC